MTHIVPLGLEGAKLPLYKVAVQHLLIVPLELEGAKLPLYKVAVQYLLTLRVRYIPHE